MDDREALLETLHESLDLFGKHFQVSAEIYRGDEFQAVVPKPEQAPLVAVLVRAAIISRSPSKKQHWDARISLGVGGVDSLQTKVGESSGQAFTLSGRGLDDLKISSERLRILTGSKTIDTQLDLPTRMADDIISHWSHYSGEVALFSLLYNESQQALAQRLHRSQPTINTRLATAKLELIRAYIEYAGETLTKEW